MTIAPFRFFQEAVNKIARHSKGDKTSIHLTRAPDRVSLRVEDNGIGFEPEPDGFDPRGKNGLGPLGMLERAASIGVEMKISFLPGKGTSLLVEVPIIWDAVNG